MAAEPEMTTHSILSNPWWTERPALWFPATEKPEILICKEEELEVKNFDDYKNSASIYAGAVFRNSTSTRHAKLYGDLVAWKCINHSAEYIKWANGTVPKFRKYNVTFQRERWCYWFTKYMTSTEESIETEWQEVVVGNRAQICVTFKGACEKFIPPVYIKASIDNSTKAENVCVMSLLIFTTPIDLETSVGWVECKFQELTKIELIHYVEQYLKTLFTSVDHK